MTPTPSKTIALLSLLSLFGSSNAAHLRSSNKRSNNDVPRRELQLFDMSNIFNSLVEEFGPAVQDLARTVLAENFDPIYLGDETTLELGPFDFPLPTGTFCQSSATVTYGVGTISGLSDFTVNTLQLVPGSETIEPLGLFGLGGATWSGTWILNATFDSLTAENSVNLTAKSCFGDPIEQSLTGSTTLNQPSVALNMTLGGETSSLLNFVESSQITTAQIEELNFELGSIDAGFGGTGTIIPTFELENSFDAFLLNEFSDDLAPLMKDALNNALADTLPIGF